jgi:hypothetical protein
MSGGYMVSMPYRIRLLKKGDGDYETVGQIGLGPSPMVGGVVTFMHRRQEVSARVATVYTDPSKLPGETGMDMVLVEEI